jgi:hypothetical protein
MLSGKSIKIYITEFSRIDLEDICEFHAVLNKNSPYDLDIGRKVFDSTRYYQNQEQILKDESEFTAYVYSVQKQLINTMEEN